MHDRKLVGAVGTLLALGVVALGAQTLFVEYGIDATANEFQVPGLAALALTALVVVALSLVGTRGGGWIDTPYW